MKKLEKISPIIMGIFGVLLIFDYGRSLTLIYCISLILLTVQFKSIIKDKFVMIPLYVLIIQTGYSLITTYVL